MLLLKADMALSAVHLSLISTAIPNVWGGSHHQTPFSDKDTGSERLVWRKVAAEFRELGLLQHLGLPAATVLVTQHILKRMPAPSA